MSRYQNIKESHGMVNVRYSDVYFGAEHISPKLCILEKKCIFVSDLSKRYSFTLTRI